MYKGHIKLENADERKVSINHDRRVRLFLIFAP